MELQKLTLYHYSENIEEEQRVTLSPMNINVVSAAAEDIEVRGMSLRPVSVMFADGGSVDLLLNSTDLLQLEEAIGSYCFGD